MLIKVGNLYYMPLWIHNSPCGQYQTIIAFDKIGRMIVLDASQFPSRFTCELDA
jgi:hypothetical protein